MDPDALEQALKEIKTIARQVARDYYKFTIMSTTVPKVINKFISLYIDKQLVAPSIGKFSQVNTKGFRSLRRLLQQDAKDSSYMLLPKKLSLSTLLFSMERFVVLPTFCKRFFARSNTLEWVYAITTFNIADKTDLFSRKQAKKLYDVTTYFFTSTSRVFEAIVVLTYALVFVLSYFTDLSTDKDYELVFVWLYDFILNSVVSVYEPVLKELESRNFSKISNSSWQVLQDTNFVSAEVLLLQTAKNPSLKGLLDKFSSKPTRSLAERILKELSSFTDPVIPLRSLLLAYSEASSHIKSIKEQLTLMR